MANNHWVRDRVLGWLAKDPTIGAIELKKKLEEQYHLQLSYYVVWDGKSMALEQLKGKWDDNFEHAFSFKAKMEKPIQGVWLTLNMKKWGRR
jgi:hypothetical protein